MYYDEQWVAIEGFAEYAVTTEGDVFNVDTGRLMTKSPTMNGDPTVGLMKQGRQYRRSVKVLVAKAFVQGETRLFNTPVQLDGDKNNCRASNIVWRPRWFAWKYTVQFDDPLPDYYDGGPILDVVNGVRYDTYLHASILNGILIEDIVASIDHTTMVFPTNQIFKMVG